MSKLAEGGPSVVQHGGGPLLHIVMFYHSVISDWNNGNAHFLRGVVKELTMRGHHVTVYEPRDAWSMENLQAECGEKGVADFRSAFPDIRCVQYNRDLLQLDEVLDTADVVIVHEWNDAELVRSIGEHHRRNPGFCLLFHDTHHRSVTDPEAMGQYDLSEYDGVLAFGNVVRDIYLQRGWTQRAWTWHEAADVSLFYPRGDVEPERDLLWIGNWGDEERTVELCEYVFEPVREMGICATVHGVRYPQAALDLVRDIGADYRGFVPNYRVPEVAARHRVMVHVPRRPYVEALPGIPTIRLFEAMACGVPLVCSYWNDSEGLFAEGRDYLMARSPREMREHLRMLLNDRGGALELASRALRTVCARHTCSHRADELLQVIHELKPAVLTRIG